MVRVSVTYVNVISSDTIEDSVRLTIPAVPTALTGTNVVTITVGIEVEESAQIFDLDSLSHHANITNGFSDGSELRARIVYEIPGSGSSIKTIEVPYGFHASGRLIHSLAARALIQTFEDKSLSITDSTDKYWNESEIVRVGKTYSLASTQTSFVATMNGVGTRTNVSSNAPPDGQSLLTSVSLSNQSGLGFVSTQSPAAASTFAATSAASFGAEPRSFAAQTMKFAAADAVFGTSSAADATPSAGGDGLSELTRAQDGNGAFDSATVERIAFPGTDIPAVPAFISALECRDNAKDQIWLAVCVFAFFKKKHAGRSGEWSDARSKAEKFVKTTLCCVFGVDSSRSEGIFTDSLDDAGGYFY
ncbi:hypothetical protein ACJ41O_005904 [Fusarium nematophilum]